MKNYLYTAIAVLFLSGAAQAQHVNIGIKGGLNVYTFMGDYSSEYDPKLSFHAGVLGHIHLNDHFALQPEVLFSGQGASYKFGGNKSQFKLGYINVPVLVQYMFDNGFRIELGPQLGILASARWATSNDNDNVKEFYKGTDIGAAVGLSYVKPSTGLGFDIRYNHGFTNINDGGNSKNYNQGVQVGIFYLFGHE